MNAQNLLNKLKISRFIKTYKGSVSVEFAFMFLILSIMVIFMADLAILRSNMGKLDNASYSLVNILRERTQLFNKDETLKAQELQEFHKLAAGILFQNPNSSKKIQIILSSVTFSEVEPNEKPTFKITHYPELKPNAQCVPATNLENVVNIAPRSEVNEKRTLPLYQVTLCIPSYSIFMSLAPRLVSSQNSSQNTESAGRTLRSSSIAVGR